MNDRLAAWIDEHLPAARTAPASAPVPDPETLAAYPPETVKAVLEASARAFDAHIELRRQHIELVREQAQIELRRLELEHDRFEREIRLTEHRIDADVKLHEHATKATAASLANRNRAGIRMAFAGLLAACVLGVLGSPWVGGVVALASLASWLAGQRRAHDNEALLAALPPPHAPPPALPERAADVEVDSFRAGPADRSA